MFPSHQQSDDFLYEISDIPHFRDFGQQNLTISGEASAGGISNANNFAHRMGKGKGKRVNKKFASAAADAASPNCTDHHHDRNVVGQSQNNDANKIIRKEIERQRRQQMAMLYAQLRSRLPLESIKGKRAVSDHMNEAVNYIKYLNKRIQELSVRRDRLKKLSNLSAFDQKSASTSSDNSSLINCVSIQPYGNGVQIVINSCFGGETSWHLSTMMQVILEERLDVVSYVSSQTDEGFLHTIQSEVSDPSHQLDLPRLQSRLNELILYY